jgi:hypothetical protein
VAKRHYLENAALEAAIRAGDRDEVARLLYILADHVVGSKVGTFPAGLEFDDVVQLCVMDTMRRLARWEPGRASAFSYASGSMLFTTMAACKTERAWAERHSRLILEREEAETC